MAETRFPKGGSAVAVYYGHLNEEDDPKLLRFPQGARITDITFPYYDTWSGTYEGKSGLFPSECVEFEASTCLGCEGLLICDATTIDQLVSEDGIDVLVSRSEFEESLEQGCAICLTIHESTKSLTFQIFDENEPQLDGPGLIQNFRATTCSEGGPHDFEEITVTMFGEEEDQDVSVTFDVYANQDDPASEYISTRPIVPVPFASFELAKRWISDCLNSHDMCPEPGLSALPTRVIDVGSGDGSEEPKLFLTHGDKQRYIALSYCWGGPQPITLTWATITNKQQCMPLAGLPAAVQDAIKVTRILDIRYLWIDALCIIQDDDSDKAIEMARMGQIYQDAFLTIAAANTLKCSKSFLGTFIPDTAPGPYRFAEMCFPCKDGVLGRIMLVPDSGFYGASKEPLNQRGWALQERLLSPRVLTFGVHQMYWQCQCKLQCDGGSTRKFTTPVRLGHEFFKRGSDIATPTESSQIYNKWRALVFDYTSRELSLRTDMLPALSGIATRFAKVLGDSYCAGLWRNDLRQGLGWESACYPGLTRPSEYRAPTWSWASVDGRVHWFSREAEVETDIAKSVEIVKCDVQTVYTTAPFGEVQDGVLELRGPVKEIDWDGNKKIGLAIGSDEYGTARPDLVKEILERDAGGSVIELVEFHMGMDNEEVEEEEKVFNTVTRRVSCIPITDAYSLILEQQQDGNYVRLGLIDFTRRDGPDDDGMYHYRASPEDIAIFYEGSTERTISIK